MLGVEDLAQGVAHHQSFEITSRADRVGRLGGSDVAPFVRYVPLKTAAVISLAKPATGIAISVAVAAAVGASANAAGSGPSPAPQISATDQVQISVAVEDFVTMNAGAFTNAIDAATSRIEASLDRRLIHHVFDRLAAGPLSNAQKIFVRQVFRQLIGP